MTTPVFVDAHCHLDEVADPMRAVVNARRQGGVLVAMTPTPDDFRRALDRYSGLATVRVGLGLHPLRAGLASPREVASFLTALPTVRYVGEVGLDRSDEGQKSWARQLKVFEQLISAPCARSRLWSVHTRRAEAVAVSLLSESGVPTALHWYTGSLEYLEKAVEAGFYFSVNPSMLASASGRRIIDRLPRERVLTETDAPYSRAGDTDPIAAIAGVVRGLASRWSVSPEAAKEVVFRNMSEFAALADRA